MVKPKKTSVLYHVVDHRNIPHIQKKGIKAGMVCAEAGMAGCVNDEEAWFENEMNIEERTREAFNDVLRDNKPKKEHPSHDYGVFLWSDDNTARYHRKAMDRKNSIGDYRIVQIHTKSIPCRCFEADFQKAEDLFQYIEDNIDDIERINNTGTEDKNDEKLIKEADNLAKDYYKTMRPWSGKSDSLKEIICPCDIPKKNIIRIV